MGKSLEGRSSCEPEHVSALWDIPRCTVGYRGRTLLMPLREFATCVGYETLKPGKKKQ